jgi:hypothetical protein
MAFRPPQRLQQVRQVSFPQSTPIEEPASASSPQRKRSLEDSQEEWVLFSPVAPSVKTETTSTDRTPRTAALSHFSEIGSLDTAAAQSDQPAGDDILSDNITEHEDDDAELDSLDDGLHAFHEPSDMGSPRARMIKSNETVLPTHDGLGTFGEASVIQDHLRQFERYNPRRKLRRTSSAQRTLDALHEVDELNEEDERILRIEQWRLDQSRALLEEIERETKRMKRLSRVTSVKSVTESMNMQTKSEYNFTESGAATPMVEEEQVIQTTPEDGPSENDSWWQRITRRVIQNLIGIDEALLSVILGEALPEDVEESTSIKPTESEVRKELLDEPPWYSHSWQQRLLEILARELGFLVHQLSEHPGAFSTYLRTQEPLPYVGSTSAASLIVNNDNDNQDPSTPSPLTTSQTYSVLFPPTLHQQVAPHADPSLWGIEEEPEQDDALLRSLNPTSAEARLRREQEYWEQELDVRMVFNFLKARFSSSAAALTDDPLDVPFSPVAPTTSNTATAAVAPQATSDPAASRRASTATNRAALIRQHHPLASVPRRRDRALNAGITRRHVGARTHTHTSTSSCASQSAKRSVRSSGSRNFWDVTVSSAVGSGPAAVGIWGEVGS